MGLHCRSTSDLGSLTASVGVVSLRLMPVFRFRHHFPQGGDVEHGRTGLRVFHALGFGKGLDCLLPIPICVSSLASHSRLRPVRPPPTSQSQLQRHPLRQGYKGSLPDITLRKGRQRLHYLRVGAVGSASSGTLVHTSAELLSQARGKRKLAQNLAELAPAMSFADDRVMLIQHAKRLEEEAAKLEAEAAKS